MQKFTPEQVNFICEQIGEWYFTFKNSLVDYESKAHRLGYAKEILKEMICPREIYSLEYLTENEEFTIVLRKDESGGYISYIVELPEIMSQGENLKEAIENLTDALKLMIETTERDEK